MLAVLAQTGAEVDYANALVGLPVAAVVVLLFLAAWRLNARGELITGREHRKIVDHLEERIVDVVARAERAEGGERYWQSVALRSLNVSEAALGRARGEG